MLARVPNLALQNMFVGVAGQNMYFGTLPQFFMATELHLNSSISKAPGMKANTIDKLQLSETRGIVFFSCDYWFNNITFRSQILDMFTRADA